jgi:hypothetical protein
MTFTFLIEYLRKTDECKSLQIGSWLCDRVAYWFGTLSRYVHVHSKGFIAAGGLARAYKPSRSVLKTIDNRTHELWPILATLLVAFFPADFAHASVVEQKAIRNAMPRQIKSALAKYLRDIA